MYRIYYLGDVTKTIYVKDFDKIGPANRLVDSLTKKNQKWIAFDELRGEWQLVNELNWSNYKQDMEQYPIHYQAHYCPHCQDVIGFDQTYCGKDWCQKAPVLWA